MRRALRPTSRENLLNFVNLTGTQFLTRRVCCCPANVYYRRLITGSINGNVNDNYLSSDYPGPPIDCTRGAGEPRRSCLLHRRPERRLAV